MSVIKNITKGQYSKKERLVLLFFFISVFLGIIIHYLALLSGPVMVLTVLGSVFSGFAGIILHLSGFKANKFTKWLIFLLLYFLVVGISYGGFNPHFRGGNFGWIVTSDLRFVMYVIIASILATDRFMVFYHHLMRFLGVWGIALGILGIVFSDFSVAAVLEREAAWNFGYFSWWLSASVFHYWGFYSIIQKKERPLGYLVVLVYLILGILFLKRAAVVNVLFIVVFSYLATNKNILTSAFRVAGTVLIFFFAIFVLNTLEIRPVGLAVNELENRFEEIDNLEEFDRKREWVAYYEGATVKQLMLGNGIGHYPPLMIGDWDRGPLNALHIGYYNIIFKGGILLSVLYVLIFIAVLKRLFWFRSLSIFERVCLGIALSLFVSMLFEAGWTYTLIPIGVYPAIFYLLRSKNTDPPGVKQD